MDSFVLHPRLAAGTHELGRFGCCHVLLKDNALFPWLLVVPEEVSGIEDLHQLPPDTYGEVMGTVRVVSEFVSRHFQPEKLNVACIGNQVRQMHIHIVGRSACDPAWPGTVWAHDGKSAYTPEQIEVIRNAWLAAQNLPIAGTGANFTKKILASGAGSGFLFRPPQHVQRTTRSSIG